MRVQAFEPGRERYGEGRLAEGGGGAPATLSRARQARPCVRHIPVTPQNVPQATPWELIARRAYS